MSAGGFSPDGTRLLTTEGTGSRKVKLWDIETQRELLAFPADGTLFTADGNVLAIFEWESSSVRLLRAPTLAEIDALEAKENAGFKKQ